MAGAGGKHLQQRSDSAAAVYVVAAHIVVGAGLLDVVVDGDNEDAGGDELVQLGCYFRIVDGIDDEGVDLSLDLIEDMALLFYVIAPYGVPCRRTRISGPPFPERR